MYEYILEKPKQIIRTEKEIPTPGEGEALIRVSDVGICGSDIHLFNGSYNGPHGYPMLFGHEWSGVVEEVGANVTKVKKGDFVTGDCSRYCGACDNCEHDKNLCVHIEKFGITINGASAEYILRSEKYLYKAPEGLDRKLFCLCEPIAVAVHLINKIKGRDVDLSRRNILVMGGGVIGMAAAMLLKNMFGCQNVELFDVSAYRLNVAKESGIMAPEPSAMQALGDENYSDMYSKTKYDIIIETTGVGGVFVNSLKLLKPLGILGCLGMIAEVPTPQKLIVTKSLTIIGSIGGTGYFDKAMEFMINYPEAAHRLISSRYPINEADEALKTAANPGASMKVVLTL